LRVFGEQLSVFSSEKKEGAMVVLPEAGSTGKGTRREASEKRSVDPIVKTKSRVPRTKDQELKTGN
jgi:hypothetical protein